MKTIKKELKQLAQELRELKQNLKEANRTGGIAQYGKMAAAKENYRYKHIAYSLLKKEWLSLNQRIDSSTPFIGKFLLDLIQEKGIERQNKNGEMKPLNARLLSETILLMAAGIKSRLESGDKK